MDKTVIGAGGTLLHGSGMTFTAGDFTMALRERVEMWIIIANQTSTIAMNTAAQMLIPIYGMRTATDFGVATKWPCRT
jgi:hypothetical protein